MFPRRYYVDKNGRRVLIGLTVEETFEFETLEPLRLPMTVQSLGKAPKECPLPSAKSAGSNFTRSTPMLGGFGL
jgi:hypothetical protein